MNKIKLFAGLGNPGEKYQNTRHNCGFWWIDFVTNNHRLNLKHNAKFNGDIAKYTEDGNCFFLKPTTFMNESESHSLQLLISTKSNLKKFLLFMMN